MTDHERIQQLEKEVQALHSENDLLTAELNELKNEKTALESIVDSDGEMKDLNGKVKQLIGQLEYEREQSGKSFDQLQNLIDDMLNTMKRLDNGYSTFQKRSDDIVK